MCSYEIENYISKQLGGQSRAIISKGPAVILVKVASEGQSKRMRGVTTVLKWASHEPNVTNGQTDGPTLF